MKKTVSVIIRSRNEENYIRHCLEQVFSQDLMPHEVIIVDNNSDDATRQIASSFPVKDILHLDEYSPGRALNLGANASTGEILVFLSAHCIPADNTWLTHLISPLTEVRNEGVVGSYGRQLPLPYSHPQDQRDLFAVFGEDDLIQTRTSFFHNANSAVLREAWLDFPFDEETKHIEDRVWAKKILSENYRIAYSARASVFHWNGMHASTDIQRSTNSISILRQIGLASDALPEFLSLNSVRVLPIIPASLHLKRKEEFYAQLEELLGQLSLCHALLPPILVSDSNDLAERFEQSIVIIEDCLDKQVSIEEAILIGLRHFESRGQVPDYVLYANPEYVKRGEFDFQDLLMAILETGAETAFFGYEDRGHYWTVSPSGEWIQTDPSLQPRESRPSTFRALYGIGTVSRTSVVRRGVLVGQGVTIVPKERFAFKGVSRLTLDTLEATRSS